MISIITAGQTGVSLYFLGITTSTGVVRTDIVFNTASLALGYTRERAAEVAAVVGGGTQPVTLALASTAWTQWGFVHVAGGLYRADFPDAAFIAAGAKFVIPRVYGPADTTFVPVGMGDTNAVKVQNTVQTAGDLAALLTTIAGYVDTEVLPGSIRAALGLASANLDTQLTAIGSKTTNLPSDPADASDVAALLAALSATLGTLATATNLAAVKAKTDQLTFTKALELDVNTQSINGVQVNGAGTILAPWGP